MAVWVITVKLHVLVIVTRTLRNGRLLFYSVSMVNLISLKTSLMAPKVGCNSSSLVVTNVLNTYCSHGFGLIFGRIVPPVCSLRFLQQSRTLVNPLRFLQFAHGIYFLTWVRFGGAALPIRIHFSAEVFGPTAAVEDLMWISKWFWCSFNIQLDTWNSESTEQLCNCCRKSCAVNMDHVGTWTPTRHKVLRVDLLSHYASRADCELLIGHEHYMI